MAEHSERYFLSGWQDSNLRFPNPKRALKIQEGI